MNPVTEVEPAAPVRAGDATADRQPVGLDASQQAVLELPAGRSAAVIGAPGSGKTRTLVEFVADRVLRLGISPSEVLVLVPTRTGATALRDRLALRLRVPTNGPLARTANSVAFQIVRDAEVAAGRTSPTLLTGGEQDQIIAEILQGDILEGTGPAWPSPLDAEVRGLRGFRTELRDLMMRAVEYGVTPERLSRLAADTERPEWAAAAQFITGYQEVKDQSRPGQFDSTELVQFAAAIVQAAPRTLPRNGAVRSAAASAVSAGNPLGPLADLRLIVLDDAQEATQSTLALLAQFAARGVTVVAFGDPDLSTGSFRGAHPDALGRLAHYLGLADVTTLTLETVHRHGPELRAVIREFTGRIGAAAAGTQRAAGTAIGAAAAGTDETAGPDTTAAGSDAAGMVQTVVTASPADQLAVIARRLRERHVLDGVPWGRMAVIVRTGALVPALSKGLAALEVPTQVAASQAALRDEPAVRAFILALDVTLGRRPLDADAAVDLLRGPLGGLDPITLRRLRAALRQQELSEPELTEAELSHLEPGEPAGHPDPARSPGSARTADQLLVEVFTNPELLESIDNRTARRAASCAKNLRQTRTAFAAGATIEELLWGLWQRSGLAPAWAEQSTGTGIDADEANHNLDAVVALFSAAQRFVERTPAAPPVLFVEHLVDTDVPEDTLAPRATAESVLVSTPSGTIGRDYDVVVLAGVQENVWPDLRIRGSLLGAGDLALLAAGEQPDPAGARTGVLHDELRMFAQAASRSTTELLVMAVDNDENQPSAFLRLLPEPDPAPLTRYPLSLRGLVGRLRRDLTQTLRPRLSPAADPVGALPAVLPARATDAAATLARLAREKVPGASPEEWYGLRQASTERPLNDPEAGDGPVRVSPSRMSAFETCPLHWLIGQIGGGDSSTAANLGTIIHKVMEDATDPAGAPDPALITADALWAGVEARWGELVFDADWQSRVQKTQARELTDRLAAYLGDGARDGTRLLSAEGRFQLDLDGAVLSGTIDRVERLPDGRAVIVDLKTGKGDPTSDTGVAEHPQLGAYQLAFAAGVIDGLEPGMELAGARLVIVSSGTQKQNYRNPTQPAFTPDELAAFSTRVTDDAAGMGGATFVAEIADHCLDPRSYGSCRIHVIKQVSS
ncbi:UrvD/REP family ATP-dependent DNA helicase [Cryobacterium sp. PAMC25264]|uniref:ATP-dependent helicase n=1 Tax=Cryobacterium sp. PAMC25264 TaxID=2861288 RepID=UPI001C628379|nr:UrvD/REP family ATP-dependent DNA helicase [Cryobacterium sp. PAMC25264]QYF75304.1 PD-(D/E)XK nuclease family protein [Cryobacterium sp. PAMC25264]